MQQRRPHLWSALVLLATVAWTSRALLGLTASARHPTQARFADLLVALSAWLLLACAGWATLICGALAVEALTASRVRATAWVGCPPAVRRTLLAVVGLGLAGATPATATAETLPTPARPVGSPTRTVRTEPATVTVRPGDTLWGLAADRLDPSAPAAEVATLVARMHRRNRAVVGSDPDLIRPGQRLRIPRLPHGAQRRPTRPHHHEETP